MSILLDGSYPHTNNSNETLKPKKKKKEHSRDMDRARIRPKRIRSTLPEPALAKLVASLLPPVPVPERSVHSAVLSYPPVLNKKDKGIRKAQRMSAQSVIILLILIAAAPSLPVLPIAISSLSFYLFAVARQLKVAALALKATQ